MGSTETEKEKPEADKGKAKADKKKDEIKIQLNKWGIIVLLFFMGIGAIFFAEYLRLIEASIILVGVVIAVGGSLVTAAVVDLLLMLSTIKETTLLLVNNAYSPGSLGEKSQDKLHEIRENATNALVRKRYPSDVDASFLRELDSDVLNAVLSDYYIESYEIVIHFNFDNKTIWKSVDKKIKYVKLKSGPVSVNLIGKRRMVNIENQEIFKIISCRVDGQDEEVSLVCDDLSEEEKRRERLYDVRWRPNNMYTMSKNEVTLESESKLILPVDDKNSTIRLSRLCKHLKIHYIYDGEEDIILGGSAFCPEASKKTRIKLHGNNHLEIEVDGSMLRGDGVHLYFQPNS